MDFHSELPYKWALYTYGGKNFSVLSVFRCVLGATTLAENQIREICAQNNYEYRYNGATPIKSWMAVKDGKIITARLVGRIAK